MSKNRAAALAAAAAISFLVTGIGLAQTASGGFHVGNGNDATRVEFHAKTSASGPGEGQMTFAGPVDLPAEEEGEKRLTTSLSMKVQFDCVVVLGRFAVMSGPIKTANLEGFAGRTTLLAVEDGGEGSNALPDKFTWGFYDRQRMTWTPTDAELKFDDGWMLSWYATDAERPDDRGVLNQRIFDVDCRTFGQVAYDLTELARGTGNIQVRQ